MIYKNVKNLKFQGDWAELRPKLCLLGKSENFLLVYTLQVMIQISVKNAHLV